MTKPAVPAANLRLKRAYEPAAPEDGLRILVDRLWPRGVSKDEAALDDWLKELAPSTDLRRWFHHEPANWAELQRRYKAELRQQAENVERLRDLARTRTITLVYAARDEQRNNAVVLRAVLLDGP